MAERRIEQGSCSRYFTDSSQDAVAYHPLFGAKRLDRQECPEPESNACPAAANLNWFIDRRAILPGGESAGTAEVSVHQEIWITTWAMAEGTNLTTLFLSTRGWRRADPVAWSKKKPNMSSPPKTQARVKQASPA
ncbi:hypothetical protein DFH09DRAFT_1092250 [Mycena vulgaris]|nr:hypothetical protein DFH09DRAFT_1092250 [Mycena vulgaris]